MPTETGPWSLLRTPTTGAASRVRATYGMDLEHARAKCAAAIFGKPFNRENVIAFAAGLLARSDAPDASPAEPPASRVARAEALAAELLGEASAND